MTFLKSGVLSPAQDLFSGDGPVDGGGACAPEHHAQQDGDGEQVELDAFALLLATPVHEEAESGIVGDDRDEHVAQDSERGDAGEEAENQADAAEELRHDGKECEHHRDVGALRKAGHHF